MVAQRIGESSHPGGVDADGEDDEWVVIDTPAGQVIERRGLPRWYPCIEFDLKPLIGVSYENPPPRPQKPPASILADPIRWCSRCGEHRVLPGVPGFLEKICFECSGERIAFDDPNRQ